MNAQQSKGISNWIFAVIIFTPLIVVVGVFAFFQYQKRVAPAVTSKIETKKEEVKVKEKKPDVIGPASLGLNTLFFW